MGAETCEERGKEFVVGKEAKESEYEWNTGQGNKGEREREIERGREREGERGREWERKRERE